MIGSLEYAAMANIKTDSCYVAQSQVPAFSYAAFEMMFAVICPLLITGAWAERFTYRAFLVFVVAWSLLVYYPVAHWIWGGGWLAKRGVLDFAGGIVIHTTAGVAALVSSLYLGPRAHHGISHVLKPHSVPLTIIGGGLLWFGWFGFNGGSSYRAGGNSAAAIVNTHVAASVCGLVWLVISWVREGRPHIVDVTNGVIAGLAGITPVAGYCSVPAALAMGVVLAVLGDAAVVLLADVAKIDDALEVSAVHGATGVVGSLSIGFLATSSISSAVTHQGLFVKGGSGYLLAQQALAVIVVSAWTAAATLAILYVIDKVLFPTRATTEQEDEGLDISMHEGHAYLFSKLAIYEELFPEDDAANYADGTPHSSHININTSRSREPLLRSHTSEQYASIS